MFGVGQHVELFGLQASVCSFRAPKWGSRGSERVPRPSVEDALASVQKPGGSRLGSTETRPTTGTSNDSNGYCVASLGLGNTARADILEGDVCGAPKTEHTGQAK